MKLPVPQAASFALASTGTEPRRIVRLSIGSVERSALFTVESGPDDRRKMTTHLGFAWSCAPGGTCRYQLTNFEMPGMPPEARTNFFDAVVKDTRGIVEVKPDGTALIQPETLMKTTPSLTELLRLAVVRLPAEPIGIGATWTASEPDLRRTYTVIALSRDAIEVALEFEFKTLNGDRLPGKATLVAGFDDPLGRRLDATQHSTIKFPSGDLQDHITKVTLR